jgi:hypothetical protein
MTALLLKFSPYVIGAVALFGAGIWSGHELGKPRYAKLQSEYSAFQVEVANAQAASQKAATDALEAQIAARNATEEHNAQIIRQLQNRADTAESDRDRANRLLELAAQSRSQPSGRDLPKAADQPGTAPASQAGRTESLADLLIAARAECSGNADRYDALIAELKPQL